MFFYKSKSYRKVKYNIMKNVKLNKRKYNDINVKLSYKIIIRWNLNNYIKE